MNLLFPVQDVYRFSDIFPLYKMSYMWYTCFGAVFTIIVALLLSPVFGLNRAKDIDPSLITPFVRNRINYGEEKDLEKVVSFSTKLCQFFF